MANPDAFTVGAEQTITFDPLVNDTDAGQTGVFLDTMGATYFQVNGFTQPIDPLTGAQLGELTLTPGPNGYLIFSYTADNAALDTGVHTLTFTYTISDENQATSTTTVTLTVTGNVIPGETVSGGNHPQGLTGGGGNDVLSGGNDTDTVNGGAGADTLHGNNGDDSVNGGAGNDQLFGDNGDDTLNGGPGDDTLTGGHGDDLFIFDFHFGHDVITDFTPGTATTHGHQTSFTSGDSISVSVADWTGFDDLMAHSRQVGTSVVFTSDDGQDTLTLQNTLVTSLHSGDFFFG